MAGVAAVIYRGPFQGRRLAFLLDAVTRAFGTVDLAWIQPTFDLEAGTALLNRFGNERPFLASWRLLDGSPAGLLSAVRALRSSIRPGTPVVSIGFSSLWYARAASAQPLVWCVNGVPEEKLLYKGDRLTAARVEASWRAASVGRPPDLVVTVSEPMGRYVGRRCRGVPWVAAPTCVNRDIFAPSGAVRRSYLTYIGTGAPWQGLDRLGAIWGALHHASPDLRFQVVSRDVRTRCLAAHLPEEAVSFVAASSPSEVATLLWESELGFLIRSPHIVNEVSFPTKFGEYVAAEVPVILTDIGWGPSDIVQKTGCGLVVDWRAKPSTVASAILAFQDRQRTDMSATEGCRAAAAILDRETWVETLAVSLQRAVGAAQ